MIGNDVVDLGDAETQVGAQHPGFDDRVFGRAELESIAAARDAQRERWRLWAAKEAAYKTLRRDDSGFVFSPRALEVELGEDGSGHVHCHRETLRVRTDTRGECLTALAHRDGVSWRAVTQHWLAADRERPALRATIGERLAQEAERRGHAPAGARLEREGRIPFLRAGARCFPVSIAHHGRFACAAVLWDCDGF